MSVGLHVALFGLSKAYRAKAYRALVRHADGAQLEFVGGQLENRNRHPARLYFDFAFRRFDSP